MKLRKFLPFLFTAFLAATSVSVWAADTSKVVVSVWLSNIDEEPGRVWWKNSVALYNSTNTMNVFVDLQFVPHDAVESKLKAAQATGTAPQLVYQNHAAALRDGSSQGLYLPVSDYLDPKLLDDLLPNIRSMITTAKGKIYSIPLYVEPYSVLFYRKDLFKAAGLDPNKPPKTWDELAADAKKLTKGDTFGLGIAGSADYAWVNWGWNPVLGFDLMNDTWSKATVNNPTAKKFLEFTKSLYDKGVVPKQPLGPFWDIQPLVDGRLAMQFEGTWAISRLLADFKDKIDPKNVGIALAPTPAGIKDGGIAAALGGWGLAIDGKAKNPKEVADVIRFLALGDPKLNANFVDTNFYAKLPVRKSVIALLRGSSKTKIEDWYNLISTKVVPTSVAEPVYPWEVSVAFATAFDNVIVNGMSADAALLQADKDINDIIQTQKLAGTNPRK
jgi:multiple sugar transport system substrate-binding protein